MSSPPISRETLTAAATLRTRAQRRTMTTLTASQIGGGIGAFAAIAVTTLLAKSIVGSATLAGIPQTSRELGAAAAAYAIARISNTRGRRAGLATGYLACTVGSVLCVIAGVLGSFTTLTIGMVLVGAGLAATWQARFAATDLADHRHSGRALSVVVWATTVGAAAGPTTRWQRCERIRRQGAASWRSPPPTPPCSR